MNADQLAAALALAEKAEAKIERIGWERATPDQVNQVLVERDALREKLEAAEAERDAEQVRADTEKSTAEMHEAWARRAEAERDALRAKLEAVKAEVMEIARQHMTAEVEDPTRLYDWEGGFDEVVKRARAVLAILADEGIA